MLAGIVKYSWLAQTPFKPASVVSFYDEFEKIENPKAEDLLAYFQITLIENVYSFGVAEMNIFLKEKTQTKKLTKNEVIKKGLLENGGFLTPEQRKKLAEDNGYSLDSFNNAFYKYFNKHRNTK